MTERRLSVVLLALALSLIDVTPARAGGLFLPTRGVRPTGRGGAFVAGADDLGALWFNPAGLASIATRPAPEGKTTNELLVDFALARHQVDYARIDSGGTAQPTVSAESQALPLPTVAGGFPLGERLVLAAGVLAPYASLDAYPEAGAQRYSLVSLHDTAMVIGEVALGWQATDSLAIGVGLQNLFFSFSSRVMLSSSPDAFGPREDPEFDALSEVKQTDLFAPSAVLGARLALLGGRLRLGAAVQLPFSVSATGTVGVRLPPSGFYDGASVQGDQATLTMKFPMMARVGVEYAVSDTLRFEVGGDWEAWSEQDEIVIAPQGVQIVDQAGVGIYEVGPLRIPRGFQDTFAVRAGLEVAPAKRMPLVLRGGYVFETGAAPDEYLTVMTVDSDKHLLAAGASWTAGRMRIDGMVGMAMLADRDVAPGESRAPQLNPIRGTEVLYVGDGTYQSSWIFGGLGMSLGF